MTFRSLDNYKTMHSETAKNKGVYEEFMKCKTLTKARKILWGEKKKKNVARREASK